MAQIKNITEPLKFYFDTEFLAEFLSFSKSAFGSNKDVVLLKSVQSIDHSFEYIASEAIYLLVYGLREILKQQKSRDWKNEVREFKAEMNSYIELIRLLKKIENRKKSDITIVYGGETYKFSNEELVKQLQIQIEKEISEVFNSGEPLPKDKVHFLDELVYVIELAIKKKNEADPYYLTLREFAFSLFKYLIDDKIYDPNKTKNGFAKKEKHLNPKREEVLYIARIYQLANAGIETRVGKRVAKQTNDFDLTNHKNIPQFLDVIKKHIKDGRNWLTNEVYNS